jgi:hypothetical protein
MKDAKERDMRWWTSAILAAEMERMLGRFEQTIRRIAGLPMGELRPESSQARAIEQIRELAAQRRSEAAAFERR